MDSPPGSVQYSPHRKMFLRANKRFKDGKEYRYWSVVETAASPGVAPFRNPMPVVETF